MVISFQVDPSLRIISFFPKGKDEEINIVGNLYYEVFPRLMDGSNDLVEKVFRTGKKEEISHFPLWWGHKFEMTRVEVFPLVPSVHSSLRVEVQIEKISGEDKRSPRDFSSNLNALASRLAHGVRNPLNAIKGAVVYLKARYPSVSDVQEFSDIILNEVAALDNFVSGQIATTPSLLKPCVVYLGPILTRLERVFSLQALGLGFSLQFFVSTLPAINGDPLQVEYAFQNLLKYFAERLEPDGLLQLTAETFKSGNSEYVRVSLVSSSIKPIFLDVENDQDDKNLQFGLFLAREIIQHQGGKLEISSSQDGLSVVASFPVSSVGASDV